MTCIVQVAGKVRDRLEVPPSISDDDLREQALAAPGVVKALAGAGIRTVVARGRRERVIADVINGEPIGTTFLPRPSADLSLAVRAIVFSAAGTAGQRCTSLRRLIVHRDPRDGKYQSVNVYSEQESVAPLAARATTSTR